VQELKRAAVNDLSLGQHMELLCMTSTPHEPTLWDESILPTSADVGSAIERPKRSLFRHATPDDV
jgi:hypothetical protein